MPGQIRVKYSDQAKPVEMDIHAVTGGGLPAVDGREQVRLLLDTHGRFTSREVRRQLENRKNELFLSPISMWEIHHLMQRKRPGEEVVTRVPLREAPFNFAVAAEAS